MGVGGGIAMTRRKKVEDEIVFDFGVFRQNLKRIKENLGLNLRERFRFFQPQPLEPEYVQPVTVKTPTIRVEEEKTYDGTVIRRYYDERGQKIKTEILESSYEDLASEPSSVDVVQEETQPIRLFQRFREGPTIIGSFRKAFDESVKQIQLQTKMQEIRLRKLEQQLQQNQQLKKKQKDEEESKSVHY